MILRDQADKTSLPSATSIQKYIRQHHDSWYQFAINPDTYGLECRPEDILMVRGFVKTSAWAVAAFNDSGNHLHSVDFSGQVGPFADAGFHLSSSQKKQALFEHRVGPVRRAPRSPSPSARSHRSSSSVSSTSSHGRIGSDLLEVDPAVELWRGDVPQRDQTVFLGYYKVKRRRFRSLKIKAAGEPQDGPSSEDDHEPESDLSIELHPPPVPVSYCSCFFLFFLALVN